jgi:hypothetical protein
MARQAPIVKKVNHFIVTYGCPTLRWLFSAFMLSTSGDISSLHALLSMQIYK